jgi:YVTN family beta-propeller protein
MPPPLSATNVYAGAGANRLSPTVTGDPALVYVPNSLSDTVSVISQRTMKVIRTFPGGNEPQHVVPAYDLKTLCATADKRGSGSLTPINPRTGKPGRPLKNVDDAYNMHFTADGRYAIVVQEADRRLAFFNPHTWRLHDFLRIRQCAGIDHMDFTADGTKLPASCEFANRLAVVDVATHKLLNIVQPHQVAGGMPQDVRLAPDGKIFYVADMMANGVYIINAHTFRVMRFQPTGAGAHGLYFSRDAKRLLVANREEGSISVLDASTGRPLTKWHIPGGGSPDMGNISANGRVLWVSGRYNSVVYAISTRNGHLIKKISVGNGPHGLCVWPIPGRYALGHTGITR